MRYLLILISISYVLVSCDSSSEAVDSDLINFIPSKSILILKSESLSTSIQELTSTPLYQNNKDLPLLQQIESDFGFTTYFQQDAEAFLAITPIGERELATSIIIEDKNFSLDSIQLSQQKQIDYAGESISEFNLEGQTFYTTLLNEVRIASASKLIVENVIRAYNNQFRFDETFYKAHKAATGKTSLFIDLEQIKYLYKNEFDNLNTQSFEGLGQWMSLDVNLSQRDLNWSGVVLSKKENKKLNLFQNVSPRPFRIHEVTPNNATGFLSISFSDYKTLQKNRFNQNYTATSIYNNLFTDVNEVGVIQLASGAVVYDLVSRKATQTLDTLRIKSEVQAQFRNQTLYNLDSKNVFANFSPLLPNHKFSVFTVYDSHFLFAKSQETLENLLVNIDNRSVLSESPSFQKASEYMSASAHLVWGGQVDALVDYLKPTATSAFLPNLRDLEISDYKSVIMQATQENSFAFVNGMITTATTSLSSEEAVQVDRFKFENEIVSDPQFFTNWRTRQKEIVVQDDSHTLHLLDKTGKVLWTKPLDSRLVGDIQILDIYRNTRLQMAFTTQNKLYVLDKNGRDVSPFPLDFKDFITEGLSIFDYDNNGKYRFVVVQDDEIGMYDKYGKKVRGFNYKSQGKIRHNPRHIRIGRKDYILVENDLGLQILNRTGKVRVKPQETINASGNSWNLYQNKFSGTNAEGDFVQISDQGTISREDMNLAQNHFVAVNPDFRVTFSENVLNINGIEKTLDYGLYLPPQIHQLANRTFFSIVDQQANKLYVFDEQAELVEGFPVFGSSQIDVEMNQPSQLNILVKGDQNAILLYIKHF